MTSYEEAVSENYSQPALEQTILTALSAANVDLANLSRDDIIALDEFHIKGRAATMELAELVEPQPQSKILDIGCGIGGPARTLAAEFDCSVIGIDLVPEYCHVAKTLTDAVGLDDCVSFKHGTVTELPFDECSFDIIWMQHVSMNIVDKKQLFRELFRVLRDDGMIAIHEVCAGPAGTPHYPVPWADTSSISHLISANELLEILIETGFRKLEWNDTSEKSEIWFQNMLKRKTNQTRESPTLPGLNLLMGPKTPEKMHNVCRNLSERRITVVQGTLQKTG